MLKKVFLFILVLSCFVAKAQEPYAIHINDGVGLPSNAVYDIHQDKKGFIWIASNEGLCRYDGISFTTYRSSTQTSSSGSSIIEDSEGRIWYQNFDGYCYYVHHDSLIALNQNKPIGFFPIGMTNKYLFLLQQNGIDVYDIKTLVKSKTIAYPIDNAKHSCATNKAFYFIGGNKICMIDESLSLTILPLTLDIKEAVHQLYTSDNRIFVVSKYNENKQVYELANNNNLSIILKDDSKLILGFAQFNTQFWVLTSEGVKFHKQGAMPQILFSQYSISNVMMDKYQNYWIGTTNNGILLVPSINNRFLHLKDVEPSVMIVHKNGYYVFTKKDEILSIDKKVTKYNLAKRNEVKSSVYYAYADIVNQNLFVSSQGTTIYPGGDLSSASFNAYAIKEVARIDDKYYAYAASGSVGILKSPTAMQNAVSEWDALYKSNIINTGFAYIQSGLRAKSIVYNAKQKAIYYASNLGLFKQTLSNNKEILFQKEKIYGTQMVLDGNKLFVCSPKGLLYKIINDTDITIINQVHSIQISDVKKIKQFDSIMCVVGDNKMIFLSTRNQIEKVGELPLSIKTNEIADIIVEGRQVHVLTHTGIISTTLSNYSLSKSQLDFAISQIKINEVLQTLQPFYKLRYFQNNITIHFTLFDFVSNQSNLLYYSINDEGWKPISSSNRVIEFASLAPGNYKLRFKLNDSIIANEELQIFIDKPFWQQWWFILIAIICFIIISYAYYRWQIILLIKKNKLITEKVELENELSKSVLTSIRSQMNPHFFYNALNTIQSYIFINDKKNASNYLSKFSKLTRTILEMSEKDFVNLTDEIEALTLYLDLEKMRFDEDFIFTISVDSSVDLDLVKIPPMLIQPYIENAIKHGLLHKEGHKYLIIHFEKYEKNLIIKISDNGIGMKRSQELNQIKNSKHQSFSNQANKKRLELLNKNNKNTLAVNITDRINENGLIEGTQVKLVIPFN